ncbi:hypothetical protein [Chryseobacterium sp. MP_3.2]|uniref:hypothetical protein n=1 Tax=Chryseobacterium sp. MP_3.2 TaxID=3071712 RepID=UPI002E0FFD5D
MKIKFTGNISNIEKTDLISYIAVHDINFIPFDFVDNESGWNRLKLTKPELEELYLRANNSNENLPTEILYIDYDESGIEAIEVEYSFVHLKRNWLNKSFMVTPYFEWKQTKPISDGQTISEAFKLRAITKTLMLIKNLKIILDPIVKATVQHLNIKIPGRRLQILERDFGDPVKSALQTVRMDRMKMKIILTSVPVLTQVKTRDTEPINMMKN